MDKAKMDRTDLLREAGLRIYSHAMQTAFTHGYAPPFDSLVLIGAEDGSLDGRIEPIEGNSYIEAMLATSGGIDIRDSGMTSYLFHAMNPKVRPLARYAQDKDSLLAAVTVGLAREGVIVVNEKGVITKAGVRLSVPEFGDDEMEETYDWIQEIAGSEEVDRELAAAANASLIPGVYGAAGLGRNTGVSLLFTEGVPIENFAYNPKGEFGCRGMTPRPVRQTSKTASFSLTGLALAMQ